MQVLSQKVDIAYCGVCVYSSKTYEEDLTEEREAPKRPISEDSCFQQYSGAKGGCSARFKRAERSKDSKAGSRDVITEWVCGNRMVEEEKMCFVIDVLSVVCCS